MRLKKKVDNALISSSGPKILTSQQVLHSEQSSKSNSIVAIDDIIGIMEKAERGQPIPPKAPKPGQRNSLPAQQANHLAKLQ